MQGTWRADLHASRFVAGFPALRSQSMHCEVPARGTIDCAATRVAANGAVNVTRFAARYDGRRYPVTGTPEMDNIMLRRSSGSIIAVFSKGARGIFAYRIVPSADGKRLTIYSIDPRTLHTLFSIVRYDRAQ